MFVLETLMSLPFITLGVLNCIRDEDGSPFTKLKNMFSSTWLVMTIQSGILFHLIQTVASDAHL
jgi:hypothetical protein